jgi:hypothetical protein
MAQTIFEQLAPYAGMTVVPNGVTVGKLNYANQQDLYSDSVNSLDGNNNVPANTEYQFLTAALTETGQGWTNGLTLGQTNSKFSKGQPPANQCFVGTELGFAAWYNYPTGGGSALDPTNTQTTTLLSSQDLFAVIQNFSWDLTIGRGITRTIGSLLEYPKAGGVWAAQTSQVAGTPAAAQPSAQNGAPTFCAVKLPIPIIFPPLINVQITAKCGNAFTLSNPPSNSAALVIRLRLGGFLMTMPV